MTSDVMRSAEKNLHKGCINQSLITIKKVISSELHSDFALMTKLRYHFLKLFMVDNTRICVTIKYAKNNTN